MSLRTVRVSPKLDVSNPQSPEPLAQYVLAPRRLPFLFEAAMPIPTVLVMATLAEWSARMRSQLRCPQIRETTRRVLVSMKLSKFPRRCSITQTVGL